LNKARGRVSSSATAINNEIIAGKGREATHFTKNLGERGPGIQECLLR